MAQLARLREPGRHMVGIRGPREILCVAGCAGRAGEVVVAVHVTLGALQRSMRAGQRESRGCVIEGRPRPGNGRVARVAGGGKSGLHVVRVGRALVVLHVARGASARGQAIVAVDVALCALQGSVRSSKSESRAGMVESGSGPGSRAVTALASLRERSLHMVRIGGALVVLHVAGDAGCSGQVVIAIHMTLRALQRGVRAGEREAHRVVVKRCRLPRRSAMAGLAGLRKTALHVIGIGRALIILQVAGDAGGGGQVVIAIHMALRALHRGMRAGEREADRIVIKRCRLPGHRAMAGLAGLRHTQRHVVGIRGLLIIRQMATDAVGRRAGEFSSNMARVAFECGVRTGQGKAREFQVIEFCP
jgi:hypothetical protein